VEGANHEFGPARPRPETTALKRFHVDCTWTGTVKAGAMGPGSPEMSAEGRGEFKWVMGGLWVIGDFMQDQFAGSEKVVTWKAHYVAGWDLGAQEYRALVVDSNGFSSVFRGEIDGDRFVITSMSGMSISDQPAKLRMTWDVTDKTRVRWLNEGSIAGGPWFLIEEYICTPS
jgi:hypothetical protein